MWELLTSRLLLGTNSYVAFSKTTKWLWSNDSEMHFFCCQTIGSLFVFLPLSIPSPSLNSVSAALILDKELGNETIGA